MALPPSPFPQFDTGPEPDDDGWPGDDDSAGADLWFLPGPEAEDDTPAFPVAAAPEVPLFDPAEWQRAQAAQSADLAALALRFGILGERMRGAPAGWPQRLALLEVADLGWWAGERIAADRLALWLGLRLTGAQQDAQALARAGWAARRLMGGPPPDAGGWQAGLAAFLGRAAGESGSAAALAEVMEPMGGLHPLVQACLLFHAARLLRPGPTGDIEAAILAARHGASCLPPEAGALFLPLALAGSAGLRAHGSAEARLAGWLRGAEAACHSALAHLTRLSAWQDRAAAALADLQGRTPQAMQAALISWPALSVPLAMADSGASRAAVQRNLDLMQARGLIREITGQSRYRVWAARI